MSVALRIICTLCVTALVAGCGGGEEKTVEEDHDPNPWAGTVLEDDLPLGFNTLKPHELAQLQALKEQFNITDDRLWPEKEGVLGNEHFEVWYRAGKRTVSHAMYMFETLTPAREKAIEIFGEVPSDKLVIRLAFDFDEYKWRTQREWWYYAEIDADTITYSPIYILLKRNIAHVAIPHEYYQWVIQKRSNYGAPRWMEEGLASELCGEGRLLSDQLREFPQSRTHFEVEWIEGKLGSEEQRKDTRVAYYHAWRMALRLINVFGVEKMVAMIDLLGTGYTLEDAAEEAYGMSYDALLAEAVRYPLKS